MNMINTENAVKIQIYVAIIAYCLVAIAQSDMGLNIDTYDGIWQSIYYRK